MTAYTDQAQERLDRLERMEPVFEALREALRRAVNHLIMNGVPQTDAAEALAEARAALALAEGVSK